MKRETLVWTILMVLGGAGLIFSAARGSGSQFVKRVEHSYANVGTSEAPRWIDATGEEALDLDPAILESAEKTGWTSWKRASWREHESHKNGAPGDTTVRRSTARTAGLWFAGLLTLAIFSFLYRENPIYRVAESIVVGVTAGYWMVVAFWDTLVPRLFANLMPAAAQATVLPGFSPAHGAGRWKYLIPLALGVMLLWRLAPRGGWIARWPTAMVVGVFCGLRMITFIQADFLEQVRASIVPIWVTDTSGRFLFWPSLQNLAFLVSLLCALTYFFFSVEHRGAVGRAARLGTWVLMITFGAAFGYTVMGRITLLAQRIEFIFDDWLWIVDSAGRRTIETMLGG